MYNSCSGWNDDWGWDDEGKEQSDDSKDGGDHTASEDWLSECEVSISSLGELIAIAKGDRLAVLQGTSKSSC